MCFVVGGGVLDVIEQYQYYDNDDDQFDGI